MAVIALDGETIDAAECEVCPGGFKLFPPSALPAHMEQVHGKRFIGFEVICISCGDPFEVTSPSRRCYACRSVGTKKRFKGGNKHSKHMNGSGIEKTESILQQRRAPLGEK